jgi:serine/threonine-protein kinase
MMPMSFFEELKRRNVVRMAVLYGIAGWLILQIADVLFEQLGVPAWAFRLVLGLLVLGFPLALIFSWVFELTPEGLKHERDVERQQSITHRTARKIDVTIIVLLVLAMAGLIADRLIPEQPSATHDPAGEISSAESASGSTAPASPVEDDLSIAVLPFVNMSGDPENEYFSDGLSEELLNTLVQIRELKVTGRTSAFAFKGQNLDLREVGQRLDVANVLEGSVRKAANRVRITAQLIKTSDGYHLWSATFDRELDDIFAIQQEIAEQVAAALSVTLLGESAATAGGTQNAAAYQAYLRGAHVFRRAPDDLDSLQAARVYYEQALALDPDYISPWYGLYEYWDRMNRNGHEDLDISAAEMQAHADKLEQLAPGSVEALLAQARSSLLALDWPQAITRFREARDRYPGNVDTNINYASVLFILNHPEEALAAVKTGVSLDPLSLEALIRLNNIETQLGYCSDVRSNAERALEIEPDAGRVRGYVGYCFLISGEDSAEAMTWLDQEPVGFMRRTGRAIALHRLGRQQEAQRELELMMTDYGNTASYQYAQVYAQWGESEAALGWLQTALEVHDPGILYIGVDHMLDPLRHEGRFRDLLQQAGLYRSEQGHDQ